MKSSPWSRALFLLASARLACALEVSPGSHCATHCLDSPAGNNFNWKDSTTNSSDIVCKDGDYADVATGMKYKKCLDCLQNSKKVDHSESDLRWFIYNLRYTINTCLFAVPKAPPDTDLHSTCARNEACRALRAPLTDGATKSSPNTTWDYCTVNEGDFMGSNLSSCMKCLRTSGNQVYLANFMTALKAGCEQTPEDGFLLGLSGTVFTTTAVQITDPSAHYEVHDSKSLAPAAIAGISVGVGLLFLFAIGLFTIHFRREKTMDRLCNEYYFGSESGTPGAQSRHRGISISQTTRSYQSHGRKSSKAMSSGEYYDQVKDSHSTDFAYSLDQRAPHQHAQTTALPTHRAYNPRTFSRTSSQANTVTERVPSPLAPAPTYTQARSNTPDSFAVQAYLLAAEDSARLAHHQPSHAGQSATPEPSRSSSVPPPKPTTRLSKIPSLVLPSLPRLRVPKKYPPPKLALQPATPVEARVGEMQISDPVMVSEPRFQDRPLGGGVIVAAERPVTPPDTRKYDEYTEVPLRSGKSTLYGY